MSAEVISAANFCALAPPRAPITDGDVFAHGREMFDELAKIDKYLDLGPSLKKILSEEVTSGKEAEVLSEMNTFHDILKESVGICRELQGLLVQAYKAHVLAIQQYFEVKDTAKGCEAMASADALAAEIEDKTKTVQEKFLTFADSINKNLHAITDLSKVPGIPTFLSTHWNVLSVRLSVNAVSTEAYRLKDGDLAEPVLIELLEKGDNGAHEAFVRQLEIAEKLMASTLPSASAPTLTEVSGSMRSGTVGEVAEEKAEFMELYRRTMPSEESVPGHFRHSCLGWAALTEGTHLLIGHFELAIENIQAALGEIST
ncbi:MAG: hypothetical protein MRY21_05095 [Simkaniaceae bacterium]|nr:hypothetical protein [Simkaniaceae bacterium]